MFLTNPDATYTTANGILLVRQDDSIFLFQHIQLAYIKLPEYVNYITEGTIDKQFKSEVRQAEGKVRKAGADPTAIYLKQREKYIVVRSEGYVPSEQIMERRIMPLLKFLIDHDIDLHINRTSRSDHYLLTGVYYHPISSTDDISKKWRKQQIRHPPACKLLANFEVAPWADQIKLGKTKLSIRPNKVDKKYHRYLPEATIGELMQLKSRSAKRPPLQGPRIHGQIGSDILLGYHLDQEINLPRKLALIATPSQVNQFTSLLYDQSSIKIGGDCPDHYTPIEEISTGFDLLSMLDEPPFVYAPVLGLIEATYRIRNFAQIFRMFYDMMEESLSPEERADFTISRIYRMLKEVPLASFEIPIDNKTKIALLQFFLQFPYRNRLEATGSFSELPRHLFIPSSRSTAKHDLMLLQLLLHYLDRDGIAYDTIIVDSNSLTYMLHQDSVIPNLPVFSRSSIIYTDTYAERKVLAGYPKLLLFPRQSIRQLIHSLDKKITASSKQCYYMSADKYIYGINIAQDYYLQRESGVPLREIEEEEFINIEELREEGPVKEIDPDSGEEDRITEEAEDTEATASDESPVSAPDDMDEFIDDLEDQSSPGQSQEDPEVPVPGKQSADIKWADELKTENEQEAGEDTSSDNSPDTTSHTSSMFSSWRDISKKSTQSPPVKVDQVDTEVDTEGGTGVDTEKDTDTVTERGTDDSTENTEEEVPQPLSAIDNETEPTAPPSPMPDLPTPSSTQNRSQSSPNAEEMSVEVSLLEKVFAIRETVHRKTKMQRQLSQNILDTIKQGTSIFGVLSRAYHATTSRIDGKTLTEAEQELLGFCSAKQLIQLETGDHYFLTEKGRELMLSKITYLRELDLQPQQVDMLLEASEQILQDQQTYGMQTHARTKLHLLQVLGLRYYRIFKVVPPLILSITNYLDRVSHFTFDDPEEFVSILDAKYIAQIEQYRRDIEENSSQVRDAYIDTEERPVPTPFPDKQEIIIEETEIEMTDVTLAGAGRLAKPQRLIETEDSQSLDESMPEIDEDAPDYLPKTPRKPKKSDKDKKTDKEPLVLKQYQPSAFSSKEMEQVIEELGSRYKREQGESIRVFTSDRDMQTRPLIYVGRADVDPVMINRFPLSYLRINGRIVNALAKVGIATIEKFRTIRCVIDIPGIGKKSLEEITTYQRLLADLDKLPPRSCLYLFDQHGQNELIDAGIELPLSELPTDVFFPYPGDLEYLGKQLYQQNNPLDMALYFCNKILGDIFHIEESEDLTPAIHHLNTLQKHRYELLYDPGFDTKTGRKPLRIDSIYVLNDRYEQEQDPKYLNDTVDMLMRQAEQVHVNSSIYHPEEI